MRRKEQHITDKPTATGTKIQQGQTTSESEDKSHTTDSAGQKYL